MRADIVRENIARLLKAASIIERKDREAEHGYASTAPPPSLSRRRTSSKMRSPSGSRRSPSGSRFNHNELEKNRRAHLRMCLDRLKETVPLNSQSTRHTTLALINRARTLILSLREREKHLRQDYEREIRAGGMLRRRLDRLSRLNQVSRGSTSSHEYSSPPGEHEYSAAAVDMGWYRTGRGVSGSIHSLSESSTASSHSFSSSSALSSELDEVDVIGLDGSGCSSPTIDIEEQTITDDLYRTSLFNLAVIDADCVL